MFSGLIFVAGLAIGLVAAPIVLPMLQARVPALARLTARATEAVEEKLPWSPVQSIPLAHVDALIAEILQQIKSKVDVDRNQVRLAQLRELLPEEGQP